MRGTLFKLLPFVIGTILLAGMVHVAIVLLLPQVASSHATARLSAQASRNTLEVLQPVKPGQNDIPLPLPFADPSMVTALCRFDLSAGPVRLRLPVGEGFLSVALLSPTGHVNLSITDRAATRRILDILLVTPEQQRQLEAQDPDDEPVQEIRLRQTRTTGIALIRGLALRSVDKDNLAALLARAQCRAEQ
jgi:uncharacterized membrane protein